MSQDVAHFLLHPVHDDWGVTRIYGYQGDGILHEVGEEIAFTQTRQPVKGKLHEVTER